MKRTIFTMACLYTGSPAHAAELLPAQVPILKQTLARPAPKAHDAGQTVIAGSYFEGRRFRLHPNREETTASSAIERTLLYNVAIAHGFDLGFSLRQLQERAPLLVETESAASDTGWVENKLFVSYWARLSLFETDEWRSNLALQYSPGRGDRSAFHQGTQDLSLAAWSSDYTPTSWLSSGVFLTASRREQEPYLNLRLEQEFSYGGRIRLGPASAHLIGDFQVRRLTTTLADETDGKRLFQWGRTQGLGLGFSSADWDMLLTVSIPNTRRYFGIEERGMTLQIAYRLTPKEGSTLKAIVKDSPSPSVETQNKSLLLQEIIDINTLDQHILLDNETDEFQILDRRIKDQTEALLKSPSYQAEQELIKRQTQTQTEALSDGKKVQVEGTSGQDTQNARSDFQPADATTSDGEAMDLEIDQFALPDMEELNWSGLSQ